MLLRESIAILMCASYCWGTRMICEELVTNSTQSQGTTQRILQGIPGAKGETGSKGSPGPPGPPDPVIEEAVADLRQGT